MTQVSNKYPPFTSSYSPNFPALLNQLGCTIAISTYQAGKIIFISSSNDQKLTQLPRTLEKAMGIAYQPGKLAVACKDEVIQFSNSKELAQFYPKKPNIYDALFVPRITYHTGYLDIHDLAFGNNNELYAVNTYFSCIVKIDGSYNFTPIWKPKFIDKIASEDRCHLNGLALHDGSPKFVTAFNQGNEPRSWKKDMTTSGVLIDITSDTLLASDLAMPHSPRWHDGQLYYLQSADGSFIQYDINSGVRTVITKVKGFVRGLDFIGKYAFIGLSKIRKGKDNIFSQLEIAKTATHSGIVVVDLTTGQQVAAIQYHASVDEIYDVKILPKLKRPNLLNTITDDYKKAVMIPSTTFWGNMSDNK